MEMGEIIKKLRIEHGLTQEELGQIIGVQKSAVRKYESGQTSNMKRSSIMKLADYFNVTPSYILGYSTSPIVNDSIIGDGNHHNTINANGQNITSPILSAIITICGSLSDADRAKVLTYATNLLNQQ